VSFVYNVRSRVIIHDASLRLKTVASSRLAFDMETKSKTWNPNWLNDGVAFFTLRDGLYADKTSPEIGELLAAAVRESTPLHRQVG